MRFRIGRSSDPIINFNETPPCKNAVIIEEQDMIAVSGKILHRKHWEVDINTIDELLELQTEVSHPLIISSDDSPEIEIYDDWRE